MNWNRTWICIFLISLLFGFPTKGVADQDSPARKFTETITNKSGDKLSFEMALIPGGTFQMGSPDNETGRKKDEGPQHEVQLKPFYLCTTETTLELFLTYYEETATAKKDFFELEQAQEKKPDDVDAVTGPTPVYGDMTMGYDKKHPAMGMTWHNAMTFCKWLSRKTGKKYRLPTEAEWEFACRGGTGNVYGGVGNDPKLLVEFSWYKANSGIELHAVAGKKPNAYGLYDMQGNVWEWVFDWYSPTGYQKNSQAKPCVNPTGPEEGKIHVARGGGYGSDIDRLRCAARGYREKWWDQNDPQIPKSKWWLPQMDFIGFRVACEPGTTAVTTQRSANPVFIADDDGGYTFNTGILRGTLRKDGKSRGFTMEHIPSGLRLDGGAGILGYYRIFTANKRYGSAGWDWPSESKLMPDGSVQAFWPHTPDRPFEIISNYRWKSASILDVETIVKAVQYLDDFEVFLASYFNQNFPSSYVAVADLPNKPGNAGFLQAAQSFGDWQMFPRNPEVVAMIQDGRWDIPPNPVQWAVMPALKAPLVFRRNDKPGPVVVLMAPPRDCFAVATPCAGESHYSLYLSLFGRDIQAGQTKRAHTCLVVTNATSDRQIVELYQEYRKEMQSESSENVG
ncbi:MAG: SUMF1/EgtB/PvdO family nonheme iron enzyme [Sedimentisphaerales bacterium]|nr:SUMF1/EgtB/PvdO family nonheme iron enzyme [Sedimentisphaerales bacterium]